MSAAMNFQTIDEEIDAIVDRARSWPIGPIPSCSIASSRRSKVDRTPGRSWPTGNLAHLIGLLKADGPPPTDEEIDRMLHDARMERYGS